MTELPDDNMDLLDADLDATVAESMAAGPIDMTAMLLRRFAWDTTPCDDVPALLTSLGLTHGSPEGMHRDHAESHLRMATVGPLESFLTAYSSVLGVVISKAILEGAEGEMCEEHLTGFADQNAEIILAGTRATVAQLVAAGVLTYGPSAGTFEPVIVDEEDDANG